MPDKIIVVADDGTCKKKVLRPYPDVVSADGSVTVTPSTDAGGKTTYDLKADSGDAASITNVTHEYDNATGDLTVTSSDGTESVPQNSHEADMYPSMQFKCKIPTATDSTTTTAALNPVPLASMGNRSQAYGAGWALDAAGTWTVPKTGIWLVDFRTLYNAVAGSNPLDDYTVRLNVNGTPLQGLSCAARDSGSNPYGDYSQPLTTRSSLTRTMAVPLNAGDVVSGEIEAVQGVMHISGFEGRMAYQSSLP